MKSCKTDAEFTSGMNLHHAYTSPERRTGKYQSNFSLTRIFVTTLLVSGTVVVIAVASDYSGSVGMKLGPGGLEFRMYGHKALPLPDLN